MGLICASLVMSDVEPVFGCSLANDPGLKGDVAGVMGSVPPETFQQVAHADGPQPPPAAPRPGPGADRGHSEPHILPQAPRSRLPSAPPHEPALWPISPHSYYCPCSGPIQVSTLTVSWSKQC
ncbi:histone acetyltransferase KAT6A-like isoform X2 [Cervus elaphus]|nr:histone acetyltransferase KAT6A-like isoform X2 [Cervus elaphus]